MNAKYLIEELEERFNPANGYFTKQEAEQLAEELHDFMSAYINVAPRVLDLVCSINPHKMPHCGRKHKPGHNHVITVMLRAGDNSTFTVWPGNVKATIWQTRGDSREYDLKFSDITELFELISRWLPQLPVEESRLNEGEETWGVKGDGFTHEDAIEIAEILNIFFGPEKLDVRIARHIDGSQVMVETIGIEPGLSAIIYPFTLIAYKKLPGGVMSFRPNQDFNDTQELIELISKFFS